jgi:hypothetical protein
MTVNKLKFPKINVCGAAPRRRDALNRCGEASHHPSCLATCADRAYLTSSASRSAESDVVQNMGYVQNKVF